MWDLTVSNEEKGLYELLRLIKKLSNPEKIIKMMKKKKDGSNLGNKKGWDNYEKSKTKGKK